jgi:hypothetical protein
LKVKKFSKPKSEKVIRRRRLQKSK